MKKSAQALIAGFLLAFLLNLGLTLLLLLISSIVGADNPLYPLINLVLPWPGLTQFIYLVPTVLHYRKLQEFERVKGITIGAIMMLLLSSACFSYTVDGLRFPVQYLMAMTIVLMIATYRWFNQRR
jgi:hypothetical protein